MTQENAEKARRFEAIADAISSDPEWFQDNTIDDAEIADGLRLAAASLRSELASTRAA